MSCLYDSASFGQLWTLRIFLLDFLLSDFCIFVVCRVNRDGAGCSCWKWVDIWYNLKGCLTHIKCRAFWHFYLVYLHMFWCPQDHARLRIGLGVNQAGLLRGKSSHLSFVRFCIVSDRIHREETIIVNRVIRDDPSKGTMHNREPITPKLLWKSLKDYDLWPIYIIGLTFQTPVVPPKQYLTLTLRGLGFNTFVTNLLVIPSEVLSIIFLLLLTYVSEITSQLTLISVIGQIWILPFLVYLYVADISTANKWGVWAVMTVLLAYPNGTLTYSHLLHIWYLGSQNHSACHSSELELPQLEHCPIPYGLSCHV